MIKLIYNGRVYLDRREFTEALIIDRGRIVKTGPSRDLLREAPAGIEKIDAQGALVLPAFYDSHLHLIWAGRRAEGIECGGAKSIDEIISRGREAITLRKPPPGAYIHGAGVNPDFFTHGEKRDLCREDIDKISVENPVILSRHCGHTVYCNSHALKLAGFSESAPHVEGGSIEKDINGRPTGVVRENAKIPLQKPMPPPTQEDLKNQIRLAMKKAHSLGITACGSYDVGGPNLDDVVHAYNSIYDEFAETRKPGLRVTLQCGISMDEKMLDMYIDLLPIPHNPLPTPHSPPPTTHNLRNDQNWGCLLKIGSIKLFADGTLGGHTAWMRQPYKDKPGSFGFPLVEQARLEHFVKKAAGAGMQVLVHAIGDAGMDAVLGAFEAVTAPLSNPLRHGIIHCQITSPDLLERMARNKILALVQPAFYADDRFILKSRVGEGLASTSYAWADMLDMGIPVSFSTDAPVSPMDPLFNMEWAMKRRVDVFSAFEACTGAASYANHDEHNLGRITPGYLADLVFLDRDIFNLPPEEMPGVKVLRTISGGETVYSL